MDKLPSTIIQHIYEYASTYNINVDKVLKQLTAHCLSITVVFVASLITIVVATVWSAKPILNSANRSITTD